MLWGFLSSRQTCYDGGCFPISYEISGIVRDGVSLLPLANVTVNSGWDIVTTDEQGYYLIDGFYGDVLTLSLSGYENLQSEPITGSTTSFDLYMFDLCYGASCPPGQICYDGGCFPISYEISGIVRDGVSLLPLANVTVNSGWDIVTTDEQGYYNYGFYDVLTLSLSGYENLQSEQLPEVQPL
ncbi:hypothetical protein [Flavobacterium sp.]|uniref:hypothetical protein n=1 Tax=Flavobacterium sp. TaxID=239 RepID=UPI003529AF73